jgi:hypothetical protein
MTVASARKWLILSSLLITGGQMLFLLVAPTIGFPLRYPKNLDILQIVTPVFLGYLGAATHFIFKTPSPNINVKHEYLGLLVKGPIILYAMIVAASLAAFGFANRAAAEPGETGMSSGNLATALSISLGLLAATTSVISSYLFAAPTQAAAGTAVKTQE